MITETVIPPLPSEQDGSTIGARCWWVVLIVREHQWRFLSAEMEHIYALGEFQRFFGREPDKIHSPPESKTRFWWMGWVTKNEQGRWEAGKTL